MHIKIYPARAVAEQNASHKVQMGSGLFQLPEPQSCISCCSHSPPLLDVTGAQPGPWQKRHMGRGMVKYCFVNCPGSVLGCSLGSGKLMLGLSYFWSPLSVEGASLGLFLSPLTKESRCGLGPFQPLILGLRCRPVVQPVAWPCGGAGRLWLQKR